MSAGPGTPVGVPVEFVSLTGQLGVQLRATVSSFGPLLLAKVLGLNETQTSVLTLVFKYCDDQRLPLLDLTRPPRGAAVPVRATGERKRIAGYGGMSVATVGVLLRKMIELEEQGAEQFFGEPEFDVHDLLVTTRDGKGVVTCLELADVQDKPALFSTFMMWLLAELLSQSARGRRPREAEAGVLLRRGAPAVQRRVEGIPRAGGAGRAADPFEGVGVFFVTQTPKDVPSDILAQLSNRVQHALRAHTPDDEAALNATVRTFPKTAFYDLAETLTSLGIGEAIVTVLDPRGVPTPVVATRLIPPASRMSPLTPAELQADIAQSDLVAEYGKSIDRESAREMLAARLTKTVPPAASAKPAPSAPGGKGGRVGMSAGAKLGAAVVSALGTTVARTVGRELIRGVFGMLGGKPPRGTSRTRW